MAEEIDIKNVRISNFEGLVTLTLDQAEYHKPILLDLYPPSKFHSNRTTQSFCGQTDR